MDGIEYAAKEAGMKNTDERTACAAYIAEMMKDKQSRVGVLGQGVKLLPKTTNSNVNTTDGDFSSELAAMTIEDLKRLARVTIDAE